MDTSTVEFSNDDILYRHMKDRVEDTYLERRKLPLKSKFYSRNLITVVNTWAVTVVSYSVAILNWTRLEIVKLARKTRKRLTLHGALQRDLIEGQR